MNPFHGFISHVGRKITLALNSKGEAESLDKVKDASAQNFTKWDDGEAGQIIRLHFENGRVITVTLTASLDEGTGLVGGGWSPSSAEEIQARDNAFRVLAELVRLKDLKDSDPDEYKFHPIAKARAWEEARRVVAERAETTAKTEPT